MPYFAVLDQYEFNNLEIIISLRKKPFIVVQAEIFKDYLLILAI
jgi:hypothetical protein